MQKQLLLHTLDQHQFTSRFSFDRVTAETAALRLNPRTASIGFIFRHIGETMNLFAQMLGVPTDVVNTTIGKTDSGESSDTEESRQLITRGYASLKHLIETSADEDWLQPVTTPFFGEVPRIRLFAHTLFHTSHHAGQISLTLSRAEKSHAQAR
ncbi:MAG: DinB family protein [Acidobacteriales bacterium]|nr:DinB family protein [Terriglobales bacterium]